MKNKTSQTNNPTFSRSRFNIFKFLSLAVMVLIIGVGGVKAQLASWALTTNGTANGVNANVTAGSFTGGGGISSISFGATGAFADGWSTGSLGLTDYFQITIAPNSGFNLNITAINFSERRSGTGIRDYEVRWSTDGFTNNTTIATVNVPDDTNERTGNISSLNVDVTNGQTLTVRFYGYNAEAGGGTWRINDATLNVVGTATPAIAATNFYSKSTGNLDVLSNWGTSTDGTGAAPSDFTSANQVFNIRNNATPTIGATWTVSGSNSKVILGDAAVSAINFTVPSGSAFTGTIDIAAASSGTNTLTLQNTTIPTFGTLNATSTVVYDGGSAQTVTGTTYGNLTVQNSGATKTAGAAVTVTTQLNVVASCTFDMSTFALTGAALTTSGTGTLRTQNLSATPLPTGRTWSMNVQYNSSSAQTVVAGTHTNLDISGGNRTLASSGTINIAGTYTPTGGAITVTGSTINYNGGDGQTIVASSYNNLSSSNNTRVLANGSINIAGTFTPGASNYTIGTSTVVFTGTTAQSIPVLTVSSGSNYYNLSKSGAGTATLAGSVSVANDVTVSAGELAINNATSFTLTVLGNISQSGGTIDHNNGISGTSSIIVSGNLNQSAGTISTGGSADNGLIVFAGNTNQTLTLSGTCTFTNFRINNSALVTLATNVVLSASTTAGYRGQFTIGEGTSGSLNASTFVISSSAETGNPTFTASAGSTLSTSNTLGINASIAQSNMTRVFTAGANYIFNAATTTAFPTSGQQPTFGNPANITANANITLNRDITATGIVDLTDRILTTTGNTLTLNGSLSRTTGTIGGTGTVVFVGPSSIPDGLFASNSFGGNLTINRGSGVSLGSNLSVAGALALSLGNLDIGANTLTLAGTVSRTSGFLRGSATSNLTCTGAGAKSLFFDNSTPATVDATTGTNALQNLILSSDGIATIGNSLNLFGILDAPTGTTLNTGGFLVLRSNGTTTARVATNGAVGVSGTVDVERFTFNRRAWRLIGAPVFGSSNNTYASNWQSSSIGTGTNIYAPQGAPNGFDGTTVSASALVWNYNTALWDNVTNTSDVLLKGTNGNGTNANFLFVRGDKTVIAGVGVTPSRAIIGARGNLFFGDQNVAIPAVASSGTQKYICVSNPYASPINFESLRSDLGTGISQDVFYVWDPRISTTGGWVGMTRSSATNYTSSINAPVSFAAGEGANGQFIQSGASFFLLPTTLSVPSTSIVFRETHKATTVNATVTGLGNGLEDKFGVDLQLVNSNNTRTIMDGVVSRFNNRYSTNFVNNNNEDYLKLDQSAETISIMNGSTKTGIDGRPFINQADTLQINLQRMVNGNNYEFVTYPSNFDATVLDAKLVDKFLNTETPLSLSAKTTVPFSVTASTGSNAADRFMIVFRGTGALPNKGFTVTGEKLGTNKVKVNWEAQAETGVREYALEKSTDGVNYQTVNTQAAKNGNVANSYTYTDNTPVNGVNYYRVKTTQHNDIERYSTVITVNFKQQTANNVVVYPNPVKGNTIGLQLQDLEKGMYSVRILSIEGKEVYKQQLQVNGSSLNTTINPSTKLAQGTYTLQVVGKSTTYTQKVVVE